VAGLLAAGAAGHQLRFAELLQALQQLSPEPFGVDVRSMGHDGEGLGARSGLAIADLRSFEALHEDLRDLTQGARIPRDQALDERGRQSRYLGIAERNDRRGAPVS